MQYSGNKIYGTGAVVGKFMPAHQGHKHLVRFACEICEHVTVVVDCVPGEWPNSRIRAQYLAQELAGLNVTVVPLLQVTPQEPDDHPEFWPIWHDLMINACGGVKPDALVCAMEYGLPLSQAMGSEFVPIDLSRDAISISATQIRNDPWNHWEYLLPHSRVDYLTRICLEGPESTGKSTIGQRLAQKMGWSWAPEWAKCWIEQKARAGKIFDENDLSIIAKGQLGSEKSLELASKPVILLDSSLLSTLTWAEFLYNRTDPTIIEMLRAEEERAPRHRWMFTPETAWFDDVHRNVSPNTDQLSKRWDFWNLLVKNAERFGLSYTIIEGDFADKEKMVWELAQNVKPRDFTWLPPTGLSYDQYSGVDFQNHPKP